MKSRGDKRKSGNEKVVSLDGIAYDKIDCAVALAMLTTEEEKVDKNGRKYLSVAVHQLVGVVQEMMGELKVSISDINRRIRRWIEYGWAKKGKEEYHVNERGLSYTRLLALAA